MTSGGPTGEPGAVGGAITPQVSPDPTPGSRVCPGCQERTPSPFFGGSGGYTWRRCGTCRLVYVDRVPSAQEFEELYGSYYRPDNLAVPAFLRERARQILAPFAAYRQTGRFLDVGYGAGLFLEIAQAQGWECWGQEVAPEAVRAGRERGWTIVQGDLLDVQLPKGTFDVVCFTEVLEHLVEPVAYLKAIFHLLRPGGVLYATTPNSDAITSRLKKTDWSIFTPPEHIQVFNPPSLRRLCRRLGYGEIRIKTEGLNPAELRKPPAASGGAAQPHRNQTGFELNERLESGGALRFLKRTANAGLTLTGLGESLKLYATRPNE